VTVFHGGVDLETFLGELHYADTPESGASIAAYLKGLERAAQGRSDEASKKRRRTKPRSEANPSQLALGRPSRANAAASTEDDPLKRTLKMLFGGANP
jgi:hypothetical protein